MTLTRSDVGFRPNRVLVTRMAFRGAVATTDMVPAWTEILRRVRELPGIEQASLSSSGLFTGGPPPGGVRTTAAKPLPTDPTTGQLFVSAGYFETLGIGLVRGRDFDPQDNDSGRPACVIVNEAFAANSLAMKIRWGAN
jgi:putative ABC transport system permease protein